MNGIPTGSLQPTWFGHVTTARDALILFEACLNGILHHVPRRPHDRERGTLIRSGCVFIYEENASGIKRWTDGVPWSPSRILGNFLVYRELIKPFPPGEKKRATKKSKRPPRPNETYPQASGSQDPISPTTPIKAEAGIESREQERALIGSLVDSYGFRDGGLVKKTMSVVVNGVQHHLVSYYRIEDAIDGTLTPPSSDPRLAGIEPRADLILRQNFRAPLDDCDEPYPEAVNGQPPSGYMFPYERSGMMVASPAHTPGMMGYSHAGPLPPGQSPLQQGMAYDTSQVPHTPGYYAASSGMTSPVKPNGYDHFNSYVPSKSPDRANMYHSSPPNYNYRHNSVGSIPPVMSPNTPRGEWERASISHPGGMYGHAGSSTPGMQSPYPGGHHLWPMSPNGAPNLPPPPGSAWNAQEQSWTIANSHQGRSNSYASGAHGGH